jgi:fructose-1,6-bisphosphatase/inositol monophosphatase family enzyme
VLLAKGAIDIAALVPIVRRAGGRVTDADALDTLSVLATNGILHVDVLRRVAAT